MSRARSGSILAIVAAIAVASCGLPEEEEQAPLLPPIGSVAGVWTINETIPPGTDPRCALPATYILYVAQNGNTTLAQTGFAPAYDPALGSNGTQFTGFLSGSTLALEGTNPQGGGTLTTTRVATVAPGCDSLITGTRTFSYTEAGFSCSGAFAFTGARTLGSGCAGTLAATAVPESSNAHDTPASAQAIATLPAEVSGTISTEEDWYSFTLMTSTPVTLLLSGSAASPSIDLALTNDMGALMPPLASSTSSASSEAVARALVGPATYKIRVSPPASGTVSYTLLVQ